MAENTVLQKRQLYHKVDSTPSTNSKQKTSSMRAFPRMPGHSTGNGWYKVFELKSQHLVDCNKSPLGETSQRYMRLTCVI